MSKFASTTGQSLSSTGQEFQKAVTSEILMEAGSEQMLLLADSRARTSRLPTLSEKGLEEKSPGFGPNSQESFARFDPDTRSWKTHQHSGGEDWEEFLETWPRSGLMRNGRCFQRPHLVPTAYGKGCSLLPTPCARDWKGKGYPSSLTRLLCDQFGGHCYPSPTFYERIMGFPSTWSELKESGTPSTQKLPDGLESR